MATEINLQIVSNKRCMKEVCISYCFVVLLLVKINFDSQLKRNPSLLFLPKFEKPQ